MKLKIAVVGIGFIGKQHVEAISLSDNLELCAVVSSNKDTKNKMETKGIPCFSTITELCKSTDVDIIDICTPSFTHEKFIIEAVKFKKNVLCEKPVTLDIESFNRIKDAVRTANVYFMVAQILRFWPEYKYIKQTYDNGNFGQIRLCTTKRICETPKWSEWFQDDTKSGGLIYDFLIHDIDFVQYLFGDVKSVCAVGNQNISVSIRFMNGIYCTVSGCNNAFGDYPFKAEISIFGDNMILEYELRSGHNIDEKKESFLYTYTKTAGSILHEDIQQTNPIQNELDYFASCIMNNKQCNRCTIESVEKTMKILAAVKKSLNSEKEEFI